MLIRIFLYFKCKLVGLLNVAVCENVHNQCGVVSVIVFLLYVTGSV